MKIVKLLAALCLLVAVQAMKAEGGDPKIKLTWGQEYELPSKHYDVGFVGNLKDGFVQISHRIGKDLTFQKFSTALKLTSTKVVDLKSMPKGYMNEGFIEWGGKTIWLFSTWDKKAGKEQLFAQEVDVKKGDLAGKAITLLKCNKVTGSLVSTGFYQFATANKYNISFSTDSNKMYVYVRYHPESRDDSKNYDNYGVWVFDQNLKELWSSDFKMPYTEKKMDPVDEQGDRDGNFLMLAKVYNDDSRKDIKDDKPNFHFEILKFSKGSKSPIIIPFKFEDKFVSQLTMLEDQQGKIVCCGFYHAKDANGKLKAYGSDVDGSFFLKLDNNGNQLTNVHKGYYEIPNSVFKSYESEKTQKKMTKAEEKGKDLSAGSLKLRKVIFGEDGSLLLVGEQYWVTTYTVSNGKYTTTHYVYHYADVIAQYIDGSGNVSWTKKIPKNQTGTDNSFGLGIRILPYNGSNYLFFLDNIKNLNLSTDQAPAAHVAGAGGFLMAVKLDATGKMEKTKLFDTREVKENIDILGADRIGDNTLIKRAFNKKKSKICLITLS